MTAVDAKVMTIVGAIKQSIETSGSPGLSVNSHPNPFFIQVMGAIDLRKAAELVIARLEKYEEGVKARFAAEVEEMYQKIIGEIKAGAAGVEDSIARLKAKAGGELLAAEGVLESAMAHVGLDMAMKQPQQRDAATAASAVDGH